MKMRFNLRRGLVVQLSLCLGIVLLLAFVASVAPAAASEQCVKQCGPCQIDPTKVPVEKTITRCSPICRVLHDGKMQTVYIWYSMKCKTYLMAQPCTDPCYNNGCSIKYVDTNCKGTVTTCTPWTQMPGGVRYDSCDPKPT